MKPLLLCIVLLAASGCGFSPNDPGEGGVTKAEAEALNEAAATLDKTQPIPNLSAPAQK
jgi:hypothetical protein